jgi:hypothetical protein
MATGPFMNVLKDSNTVFGCDAPLEDARRASLVLFPFDDYEGFVAADHLPAMGKIFGYFVVE